MRRNNRVDRPQRELYQSSLLLLVVALALTALAAGALAHTDSEDHGTITFHDRQEGPPQSSAGAFSDPVQTECQFWIRGYGMTHEQGQIEARLGLSLIAEIKILGEWNATENEDGTYDFVAGPYTLQESGNWTVWVSMDGHESRDHDVRYEICGEAPVEPPACPLDVRISLGEDGDVSLRWNASARAEAFVIYRTQVNDTLQEIAEVNATAYLDTRVNANTTYDYRVTALNGAGEAKGCRVLQISIPSIRLPSCPLDVNIRVTSHLVALTWNATERADAFLILRGHVDAEVREIARVEGTTFLDLNVNPGHERRSSLAYVVVAINAHGEAKDCPPVRIDEPPQGEDEAPPCPGDLQAHPEQSGEVTLTWKAADRAETYHVYRATGESALEHIAETGSAGHVDSATQADTTYRYRVTAANEAGESGGCPSVEVTAIPFFGSPLLVGLAVLGSLGVVAAGHRGRG